MNSLLSKREGRSQNAVHTDSTIRARKSRGMNNLKVTESLLRCVVARRRLLLYMLGLLVIFMVVSSMYNIESLSRFQKLAEDSRHPVDNGILLEDRRPKPKKYCANAVDDGNFYINHFRDAVERLEFSLGFGGNESPSKSDAVSSTTTLNKDADANSAHTNFPSEALVILLSKQSENGLAIIHLLEALRMSYRKELVRRGSVQSATPAASFTTPILTDVFNQPRYAVIIFDSFDTYRQLDAQVRAEIDSYCKTYRVGIILFSSTLKHDFNGQRSENIDEDFVGNRLHYPVRFQPVKHRVAHFQLASRSNLFTIAKPGTFWTDERVANENAHVGEPLDSNSKVKVEWQTNTVSGWAELQIDSVSRHQFRPFAFAVTEDFNAFVSAIHDFGAFDGVERVLFGSSVETTWLHTVLFVDTLDALTRRHTVNADAEGKPKWLSAAFGVGIERFILVDIDDMFVAAKGTRLTREDVQALLAMQRRVRDSGLVKDFHFNAGFCGKYFEKGTEAENDGDHAVLENRAEFWWFDHSWSHFQPHLARNATQLLTDSNLNRLFAEKHGILVDWQYAVAPHHSGVYPIHEALFEAWQKIGVNVTSTEEYPHLRPARLRRGFVHRNVHVLPRQTCGLYTHTLRADDLKDGFTNLIKMLEGGELFQTVLLNPINVFMTHMPNYGSDRLGLFLFESLFDFIACNTNLKLRTVRPTELAERYFQLYPADRDVMWTSPCDDNRHLDIWPSTVPHPLANADRFLTATNLHSLLNATGGADSLHLSDVSSSRIGSAASAPIVRLPQSCYNLPEVLIIGPQKTGTTALYTFLKQHPAVRINAPANDTFEEVQFFSNAQKYLHGGASFYQSFFDNRLELAILTLFSEMLNETEATLANVRMARQFEARMAFIEKRWQLRLNEYGIDVTNRTSLLSTSIDVWNEVVERALDRRPVVLLEKSATYFDHEQAPSRVSTLLPRVRLIAVLINPIDRAYSWYQHMRSKADPAASNFSFAQVLTIDYDFDAPSNDQSDVRNKLDRVWSPDQYKQVMANKQLLHRIRQLRNRCLEPGHYATHIENWLHHVEPSQLAIVDGKQLREQPVKVMQSVQKFLRLSPTLDYSTMLRFSEKKGFYCVVEKTSTEFERLNCLGKSKGRTYAPLDTTSEAYLRSYYAPHNTQLVKLLRHMRIALPFWLQADPV